MNMNKTILDRPPTSAGYWQPTPFLAFITDQKQRYHKTPYLLCQRWDRIGKDGVVDFEWVKIPIGFPPSPNPFYDTPREN